MKKREYDKSLQGSITVEAAFIVPLILFCLIALIGVVMYLFNDVRAAADADGLIYELERELAVSDKKTDKLEKNVSSRVQGYMSADSASADISLKKGCVTVRINVKMKIPERGILGLLMKPISRIEVERTAKLQDREDTQRIIRSVEDTIGMIKGYVNK